MESESSPARLVQNRLALVIGNSDYRFAGELRNPVNDARAIAEKLIELGFLVRTEYDLDAERFRSAIGTFCKALADIGGRDSGSTVGLLYFAGHGVQVRGTNYLLPVDGQVDNEVDLKLRTIDLEVVMEAMNNCASTSIILLDCCRNNPLPRTLGPDGRVRAVGADHGLAGIDVPNGSFVAFATQPDNVAEDGAGSNSPFTAALIQFITQADTPISEMMIHVRRTVHRGTGGRQVPWDRSALFQPFAFKQSPFTAVTRQLPPEEAERIRQEAEIAREQEYWELIGKSESPLLLQSFVQQFPGSPFRREALRRIDAMRVRQLRRAILSWASAVVLGAAALLAGFVGIEWMRFTNTLPGGALLMDADFVGNDIQLQAVEGGASPTACTLRCIFTRDCLAFSYDPSRKVCYLKDRADFYVRPSEIRGADPSQSWYMRGRGWIRRGLATPPQHMPMAVMFDRGLVGEEAPRDKIEQHPLVKQEQDYLKRREAAGLSARSIGSIDARTGRFIWRLRSYPCQQVCLDLKEDCRGFTFTPFGNRCELFRTVKDVVREAGTGRDVHVPVTVVGCLEPSIDECRLKGQPRPATPRAATTTRAN